MAVWLQERVIICCRGVRQRLLEPVVLRLWRLLVISIIEDVLVLGVSSKTA
jgi:hypothetical protein